VTRLQRILYEAAAAIGQGQHPARYADVVTAIDILDVLAASQAFSAELTDRIGAAHAEVVTDLLREVAKQPIRSEVIA
jgi:hypothetical protein